MSKIPVKKPTTTKHNSSPAKKPTKNDVKPVHNVATKKTVDEKLATASDKPEIKPVKIVKMKEVVPKEMEKLQDLTTWPIIIDEVGE